MNKKVSFKEKQREMREEAILEAAREILSGKGILALTMDEVASSVGIAKGSLYQHFSSKEELIAAALRQLMRRMEEFITALPETEPAISRLRQLMRWALIVRFTEGYPDILSVKSTMQAYLSKNSDYTAQAKRLDDLVATLVTQAKKDGDIDERFPTTIIVQSLAGRIRDSQYDELIREGEYKPEELAGWVVEMVFRGIFPADSVKEVKER